MLFLFKSYYCSVHFIIQQIDLQQLRLAQHGPVPRGRHRRDDGELLGQRQSMIQALRRLGGVHAGELPSNMQALGIAGSMGKLFATHPPIEERIARLQQLNQ